MAKRLYSFPPDAEHQAEEIRAMLEQNNIEFYETPPSRWGFSNASIWIKNNDDFPVAKSLFEQEIIEYAAKARERFEQETGYNPNANAAQRLSFNLRYLVSKRAAIPLVVFGLFLVGLYFYLFFKLFI